MIALGLSLGLGGARLVDVSRPQVNTPSHSRYTAVRWANTLIQLYKWIADALVTDTDSGRV